VVFFSTAGSPVHPFYFMLHPDANGYRLEGEGTGLEQATAAAANELGKLSERDIDVLIEQTDALPRKQPNAP
jgi:hypothetical protein